MPYKLKPSKRKSSNDKNFKYDLSCRYKGEAYRKRVSCPKSEIQTIYHKWKATIFDGSIKKKDCLLFENLSFYRESKKNEVSENYFKLTESKWKKIRTILKDIPLSEFRRCDVEKIKITLIKEGYGNSTVNSYVVQMSDYFSWLIKNEFWEKVNPAFKQKLKERNQRVIDLTDNQIKELLTLAEKQSEEFYLVILIAVMCGMRQDEILKLKWEEIDLKNRIIKLPASRTKNKKSRNVPVFETLFKLIQDYRKQHPFQKEVFQKYYNSKRWGFLTEWEKFRNQLSFATLNDELKKFRFHDLRHLSASIMIQAGLSMQEVQQILGHCDVRITQTRYANQEIKHIDINKLSKVLPL